MKKLLLILFAFIPSAFAGSSLLLDEPIDETWPFDLSVSSLTELTDGGGDLSWGSRVDFRVKVTDRFDLGVSYSSAWLSSSNEPTKRAGLTSRYSVIDLFDGGVYLSVGGGYKDSELDKGGYIYGGIGYLYPISDHLLIDAGLGSFWNEDGFDSYGATIGLRFWF